MSIPIFLVTDVSDLWARGAFRWTGPTRWTLAVHSSSRELSAVLCGLTVQCCKSHNVMLTCPAMQTIWLKPLSAVSGAQSRLLRHLQC